MALSDVQRGEQGLHGTLAACHATYELPEERRGMCAGWLLEQKERGVPSLPLRMLLMSSDEALEAFDAVSSGGIAMIFDEASHG